MKFFARLAAGEHLRREVTYALRSLGRTPGLTLVIVFTLALGIGVSTSIYSVARVIVSATSPFPDPQELLSIQLSHQGRLGEPTFVEFEAWKSTSSRVADIAAFTLGPRRIGNGAGTVEAYSLRVTGEFFAILQAQPFLGRGLLPSDISAESEPVAVVSHRLWQDLFGADPSAVGRHFSIGGQTYLLVGVLERGQEFPAPVDVWAPLIPTPDERAALQVTVIGRRAPNVGIKQAQAFFQSIHQSFMAGRGWSVGATQAVILPVSGPQNESAGVALFLLAVSVGSILLIGIANSAGLVVTRSMMRDREIAIRVALGASRARIAFQLVAEMVLLALAAGGVGLVVAWMAIEVFRQSIPEYASRQILGWSQLGLDGNVIAFATLLALVAGLGCGLLPALGSSNSNVASVLQQGSTATTFGRDKTRLLHLLLIGEVAVSVTLLLCAGLLGRSLLELSGGDPGFSTDNLVTVRWNASDGDESQPDRVVQLQDQLLSRAAGLPGIESVALSASLPSSKTSFTATREYEILGSGGEGARGRAQWRPVTPGFLEALQIPLLHGRALARADGPESGRVALISEAVARRHWPGGESPLGQQFSVGEDLWTVIGVVGNVHSFDARGGLETAIYIPQTQSPTGHGFLVARVSAPVSAVGRVLREELWRADPKIALGKLRTLDEVIDDAVSQQRLIASFVAAYALTAVLITLISVYAVVAHFVVRRRREYGIHLALGASPSLVIRKAMGRALGSAVIGVVLGVGLAMGLAQIIRGLLYGIHPLEPAVFGVMPALLIGLLAIAVFLPARSAAKVDPIDSLRS